MAYYSQQGATIMQGVGSFFEGKPPVAMAFKDGSFGAPMMPGPGALRSYQDGSLGEYFDTPAQIARPERYDLDGSLMSFRDGSLGARMPGDMPGADQAYEGGILHALGLPLFVNGKEVTGPLTIRHGSPEDTPAPLDSGASNAMVQSMVSQTGVPEGEARAYGDGILGRPEDYSDVYAEGLPSGPMMAYDEGVLGMRAIRSSRTHSVSGLGASDQFVIDMKDPQWVKELKTALVYGLTAIGITEPMNTLDTDWYESPYWNGKATGLTRDWANLYRDKVNPQASTGLLLRDAGSVAYPTVTGIVTLVSSGVGVNAGAFTPQQFPRLYAFMQEMAKLGEGGKLGHFRIEPPYESEAAKIRTASAMSMSNLSLMVMGGVALAAVGVIGYTLWYGR